MKGIRPLLSAPGLLSKSGEYACVSPAAGFWCLLVVLTLLMADALSALRPAPLMRGAFLVVVWARILASGILSDLSVLQEFSGRRDAFFTEFARHLASHDHLACLLS